MAKLNTKPAQKTTQTTLNITTLTPELTKLAEWLKSAPVNEVEVESAGTRLRLSKAGSMVMAQPTASAAPAAAPSAAAAPANHANAFKSPMVGTFYSASTPEAPPFIKVGDSVQTGQTLGIIEAMKTMNQITATSSGIVTKIMVENAQPVEFGQPLFIIE
ncbi:MAG: acetyl-CoA carboxylase biotin carboxyl carrier protein [Proteobacteria bacterium]|nr:acetyl-CoA carboxylase biotin carboxyl carrier protein [Pseudomonadota bacterium]NBX86682.1 acetyl-CoA carboxylase biotin carboxyl carrier protein [Pseudomonadota bacterium]